ncbi:hypothetical protein, partial [Nocardia cyriacigeorgica]|uniref:hypothetical protein n=1 Tax=Nocardia cyriacigeorgica TaxID=135487 RepID=UPI002458C021
MAVAPTAAAAAAVCYAVAAGLANWMFVGALGLAMHFILMPGLLLLPGPGLVIGGAMAAPTAGGRVYVPV